MKKIHILRTDKNWKSLKIGACDGVKVFCVLCVFSITFIALLVISCIVISVKREITLGVAKISPSHCYISHLTLFLEKIIL